MAPAKLTKAPNAPKLREKLIEKTISHSRKRNRKSYDSFSLYIYKVLRTVTPPNFGISKKCMLIMNNFVNDMLEKIAAEAGRLVAHGKKTTLSSREIHTAVKLLIPGELAKHANIEAMKAITLYHATQTKI